VSFVGYKNDEDKEDDDDKDFISDFLSWDDDSEEVPRERDELSTDLPPADGIPPTMTCDDTDKHPTVHQDVDFSELEIATLELMSLCDRSGA
jgi:hypothetical protein